MMTKWKEPPEVTSVPGKHRLWRDRLAPLLEKPGKWAVVYEGKYAHNVAYRLRSGFFAIPFPSDPWEFISREGAVYARYMGEGRRTG